jgi:hypothetical protein
MLTENGTVKIDIINKISMIDSIIWKAKFTNDILYKYEDGYTFRDTSVDTVNIIEDLNGSHRLYCENFPFHSMTFDSTIINRYAVPDSDDIWTRTIETDQMKYIYEFKKGVGAISYSARNMCTCLDYWYATYSLSSDIITQINEPRKINNVKEVILQQNYPNPFNPSTTISFSLPSEMFISLKIYDSIGRKVSTIVSGYLPSGTYKYQWNASHFSSGIYYYRLQYGSSLITKKLILLK